MPTQVTPQISQAEELFKSLVWDNLVRMELAAFYVSQPWAAVWPLSIIINALVKMLGDKIFESGRLLVDVGAIKLLDEHAEDVYRKASIGLAIIAHDKGINSDEFKIARENAKALLSTYARFNH